MTLRDLSTLGSSSRMLDVAIPPLT
jgi:hypothetical protein